MYFKKKFVFINGSLRCKNNELIKRKWSIKYFDSRKFIVRDDVRTLFLNWAFYRKENVYLLDGFEIEFVGFFLKSFCFKIFW